MGSGAPKAVCHRPEGGGLAVLGVLCGGVALGAGRGVWPRPLGEPWALRLPLAALAGPGRQPVIGLAQQVSLD